MSGGAVIVGDKFVMPAAAVVVLARFEAVAVVPVEPPVVPVAPAKVRVAKPSVTATGLVYTGGVLSAGIAQNAAYTVSGGTGVNAGSYSAAVALNDAANYEWADGTAGSLVLGWSIGRAAGVFGSPGAVSAVYSPGLRLSDLVLPAGYAWVSPATALVGGGGCALLPVGQPRSGR